MRPSKAVGDYKGHSDAKAALEEFSSVSDIPRIPDRVIQIDHVRLELLGRYFPFKHDIQFLKSATFRLGDTEIRPNQADEGYPAKEETQLPSHIRFVRVNHVRDSHCHHNSHCCLDGGSKGDRSTAHSGR